MIDYPIPGYLYELCWKVPLRQANNSVCGPTIDYQKMLLQLGKRRRSEEDRECHDQFTQFARALMEQFASKLVQERQAVFLMVYNTKDLNLYPALSHLSYSQNEELAHDLKVPLGEGVSGAAFLQRQVVAWGKSPDSDGLIRPIPVPGLDAEYILALPIFYRHDRESGGQLEPEPGGVIAVVTLASNARGSGIERCRGDTEKAKKFRATVQLTAQAVVSELLERLSPDR